MDPQARLAVCWKRFDMQMCELLDHRMGLPELVRCMRADQREVVEPKCDLVIAGAGG